MSKVRRSMCSRHPIVAIGLRKTLEIFRVLAWSYGDLPSKAVHESVEARQLEAITGQLPRTLLRNHFRSGPTVRSDDLQSSIH